MSFYLDSNRPAAAALILAALWAAQVGAQTPATAEAKPVAPVAAAGTALPPYRSALDGYQRYTEEKTVDWKQANDTTARIGGWREYARQASQPQVPDVPAPPDSDAAPAKP